VVQVFVPIFPLPDLTFFPHTLLPLHIFEARYRELIGECIDGGGEFGLVLADDEGMRSVGTRAAVVEVLSRPSDGSPLAERTWTPRYAAARIAWHALDHAWEIEDRSEPAP
jgi:Lon protease-like protein